MKTGCSGQRLRCKPLGRRDVVARFDVYCARGQMENRIKEQQLMLFAERTSTHEMRSNQIRLWFSSLAYVIVNLLRRVALEGTEMARAQCATIRLRLLKIGAQVKVTVRKVRVALAESWPWVEVFREAWRNIARIPLLHVPAPA